MNKCSAFILPACVFALLTAERVAAAPVTWDFIATGCTYGNCLSGQHYPVTLATLILPGPDSSGTAVFGGWGPGSVYPAQYTGDSFVLEWSDRPALTPAFTQNNEPFGECEHLGEMCQFDLSWSEHAGQLDALRLSVYGIEDSFLFPAWPGSVVTVASDYIYRSGNFAGCDYASQCQISGFWVNDALVTAPEPGSLALLAGAFGVWRLIGLRCTRLTKPRAPL
jgi:hypothetical protein